MSYSRVEYKSGPSMGAVGSGRVGSQILRLGWVGLGRVQCQKYPISAQFTRKKQIIRRLYFIIIESCNIAIYYRLIIYSNIKDALFG